MRHSKNRLFALIITIVLTLECMSVPTIGAEEISSKASTVSEETTEDNIVSTIEDTTENTENIAEEVSRDSGKTEQSAAEEEINMGEQSADYAEMEETITEEGKIIEEDTGKGDDLQTEDVDTDAADTAVSADPVIKEPETAAPISEPPTEEFGQGAEQAENDSNRDQVDDQEKVITVVPDTNDVLQTEAENASVSSNPTINTTNVKLYAIDESYQDALSIPTNYEQQFRLKVTGCDRPEYEVTDGDSVTIDSSGLIKPAAEIWYWNGGVGSTWSTGAEGERKEVQYSFGKSTIKVRAGKTTFTVTVTVYDYAQIYSENIMDRYIAQNISEDMPLLDKLDKIAAFPAQYDYDERYSSASTMIIYGGGDCWASSDAILHICKKIGLPGRIRDASGDPNAGSGHRNVVVSVQDKTYILDAGYDGTAPRIYDVYELTSLFQYQLNEDGTTIMVTKYDGADAEVVIPSIIDGYEVTRIANGAFWGMDELTSVTIPEGVEGIGYGAFQYCTNLQNISLPNTLVSIGQEAFSYCSSLTSITIPKNVEEIYTGAFIYDQKLTTVTFLGDKTTTIGDSAFHGCWDLVIYGIDGSYIQDYAAENDIPFNAEPIKNAVITVESGAYSGKPLTPLPTVKKGNKTLVNGTDYQTSYSNNINAGTATVTITGKGNYTGTKTATFRINKAAQNISVKSTAASIAVGRAATVSITGSKGTKSYKSSNTAVATVTAAGRVTARKVGTVKITATSAATANYNAASKTVTIKVVPAATASIAAANQATGIRLTWKRVAGAAGYKVYRGATLIRTIKSGATVTCTDTKANANGTRYIYKVIPYASTGNGLARSLTTYRVARPAVSSVRNSAAKKMTVRWGRNAKANGYQIQYSTSRTFASGNKAVTVAGASTVSKVIGSLAKGKTYYVRIRTYKTVGKAKYWSIWSPAKTVKITK